jgi:hypothetical protein
MRLKAAWLDRLDGSQTFEAAVDRTRNLEPERATDSELVLATEREPELVSSG